MKAFVVKEESLVTGREQDVGIVFANCTSAALDQLLTHYLRRGAEARKSDPRLFEPPQALMLGDHVCARVMEADVLGEVPAFVSV